MKKTLLAILCCLVWAGTSLGQTSQEMHKSKVASVDAIIESLYDVVSGEKTEERDWELMKYLCHEDAKLISYGVGENGESTMTYMSIDDYVKRAGGYFKTNDFFEKELHRTVDAFGPITHVFSTYESFHSKTDKTPFARGINSIQLLNDGERWWIVNVYWTSESETNPIPKKYLPKG